MANNELLNYHELSLKSVSQMQNIRGRIDQVFLQDQVVRELENQSGLFGLLYLIGLQQRLKATSDHSLDNFFKGAFYKRKTPFLIGITGAVSVGKSTFAKQLAANLHQINSQQRVEVISTDDFLYPNDYLMNHDLMDKKGFPESFDNQNLWDFLVNAASFNESQDIPIYDHQTYDILPQKTRRVRAADYLIIEGINILQLNPLNQRSFREMLDLTIYLDAKNSDIINWFLKRFDSFLDHAQAGSYYETYAQMDRKRADQLAQETYAKINQPNFERNIAPTRNQAQIIVDFDQNHVIDHILMRDY